MTNRRTFSALRIGACLLAPGLPVSLWSAERANSESGQITLRKSIGEREYKGKTVEGEERHVAPGDSLWRILIQEKGLSEKRFPQYIVVIRGLNPGLSPNGALRIGETLFIPLRPDEVLQVQSGPSTSTRPTPPQIGKGSTEEYRIKRGDHLYQVLRERLVISDQRQLATYYALVKDLNPQKKDWDMLVEGETIRLPVFDSTADARSGGNRAVPAGSSKPAQALKPLPEETKPSAVPEAPVARPVESKPPEQRAARENFALVSQVIESLGNEVEHNGEEAVAVKEGTVRLERNSFPLVINRKLDQRLVLDFDDKIPPSIRAKLGAPENSTTVFSFSKTMTVKEAVSQLLSRLGYQPLSANRPLVIQEGGLAFEPKGEWTVLAPQESNKRQEIFIINIGGNNDDIPEYLKSQLAASGVHFKEVPLASSPASPATVASREPKQTLARSISWPRDKREIVDAVLFAHGIPFGVSEVLPVEVQQGLKIDTSCDRLFEVRGRRTALFFHRLEPEIKRALERKLTQVVELDLAALSSRELIGKLLREVGEPASYEEHRFNAATGVKQDKLVISAWGFLTSNPAMLVTDRQIPKGYERFFFDQGLDIVYFQ